MTAALGLARRALGTTWPNPAVGCVIVRDGDIVGRARTGVGGRPHAETEALRQAGAAAAGATAYVTLEPCDHHGKTPPCSLALIAAGIGHAVVALVDPDPRVSGAGIARLRAAGIPVEVGLCAAEARALNAGFLSRIEKGRPLFTWKTATTLDGRIATAAGESQWITGETARAHAHRLRASHDAIMIGIGTALADRPLLTCRLPGLEGRSPVRIVVDGDLRLPLDAPLVVTAGTYPTWIVTATDSDTAKAGALEASGAVVLRVTRSAGGLDLDETARLLAGRGLTRVLVEGGAQLAGGLLRAGLIDAIAWFRAASVIGGDGVAAASPFGVARMADMPRFALTDWRRLGTDVLETYGPAA